MPDYLRQMELVNNAGIPVEFRYEPKRMDYSVYCRIPNGGTWQFLAHKYDVEVWDARTQLAPLVLKLLYGGKLPEMGNTVEDKAADIGYKWGAGLRGLLGTSKDSDPAAVQFIAMRLAKLEGYADMDTGYAFISSFVKGFSGTNEQRLLGS